MEFSEERKAMPGRDRCGCDVSATEWRLSKTGKVSGGESIALILLLRSGEEN